VEPIRCHICNKPLKKIKLYGGDTQWICYNDGDFELSDHNVEKLVEDLSITTCPKQNGKIVRYFATVMDDNDIYYVSSYNRDETFLIRHIDNYDRDKAWDYYHGYIRNTTKIPKFFNLKLKEPLGPQLQNILAKLKLLIPFA